MEPHEEVRMERAISLLNELMSLFPPLLPPSEFRDATLHMHLDPEDDSTKGFRMIQKWSWKSWQLVEECPCKLIEHKFLPLDGLGCF